MIKILVSFMILMAFQLNAEPATTHEFKVAVTLNNGKIIYGSYVRSDYTCSYNLEKKQYYSKNFGVLTSKKFIKSIFTEDTIKLHTKLYHLNFAPRNNNQETWVTNVMKFGYLEKEVSYISRREISQVRMVSCKNLRSVYSLTEEELDYLQSPAVALINLQYYPIGCILISYNVEYNNPEKLKKFFQKYDVHLETNIDELKKKLMSENIILLTYEVGC